MKKTRIILLISLIIGAITFGCQKDNVLITNTLGDTHFEQSVDITGGALERSVNVEVSPSGDLTGQTDADNIEAALDAVKASGGTVHLMEGNFYTSRNIIVENFNGVLEGEGMEQTIIHAVRQSEEIGFEAAISPYWSSPPLNLTNLFANVIQLDNATGDVVITNLSILVPDDQPTNIIEDYNGYDGTYLSTIIEILGGEHNTLIENVRLEGKESVANGNVKGMNASYGIHVMLNPPGVKGKGNLTIKNVNVENTGNGAVLFMKFNDESNILIDDVRANNVGEGIRAGDIDDSSVKISNLDISIHPSGWMGMWLFRIPSGLEVNGNSISNAIAYAIAITTVTNAQIVGNTIIDHQGCCPWSYGIALRWFTSNNLITNNKFINMIGYSGGVRLQNNSSNNIIEKNDYKLSNLPGWTEDTPNGPGAVFLGAATQGNEVFEMKFPPGQGVTLCEMVLDLSDDPNTPEYDGNNLIHHWQPCENLQENNLMMPERDEELQEERMRMHR